MNSRAKPTMPAMQQPVLTDADLQTIMDRAFQSAVGVIIASNDIAAVIAHLRQALRPLAALVVNEQGGTPAEIERAAQGMAVRLAYELWNATPIPENHFRPRKLAPPERNAPCPCGSQRKYKQCCGAGNEGPLILPPDEMLGRVLDHLPRTRLGEPVSRGVSPHILALVASRWCDEQRFDDVIALLEPLFIDLGKLDERAADAANILMNCYLARQQYDARNALVERLKKSHNRVLRSTGLQREATVCSDRGDIRDAWRAFNEARHLTPDDPSLSHLEVLLLLAEGRDIEARERADYWTAVLAADPRHDNRALIEALHTLGAEAAADDPLDDLPQDYPERRLVLHIALEDIDPPIWRRVEVENTLSFEALHHVIQAAMGWEDAHLHEFKVGDYRIGMGDSYDNPFDDEVLPSEHVELGQVIGRRRSFSYEYDFGDGWRHRITIEKRLPSAPLRKPAALLDGERACPPEDCGGVSGYYNILEAKRSPRSAESQEILDWLGPYKPESFKLTKHQKQVDALFKRIR